MRYIRLLAVTDEYNSTEPGLALKGADRSYEGFMADRLGGLVAHDIVEHQNGAKNIGSVDDELEASGGVWHARGRWGDIGSHHNTPHNNCAADISNMFREQAFWTMPTNGTRLHEELEDDLEEILVEAKRQIKAEAYEPEDLVGMDGFLEASRRRFRIGYRKATRRFGPDYVSNQMYRNIRRALETTVKQIDYEGQEFILAYDRSEAKCNEVEYNNEYY